MQIGSSRRGRIARAGVIAVTMAVGALLALSPSPARSQTDQAGSAPIIAAHSFKVMDVLGGSNLPATPVVQWAHNDGLNQKWRVHPFSTIGSFQLVIIQSVGSGRVLDVSGGSTDNGADLVQNPWSAAPSQLWIDYPLGTTGYDMLINVKSGKVADVAGASKDNGASIIQWDWNGGLNQIWLVPDLVTATTSSSGPTSSSTGPTSSTTSSTACNILQQLLGGC